MFSHSGNSKDGENLWKYDTASEELNYIRENNVSALSRKDWDWFRENLSENAVVGELLAII